MIGTPPPGPGSWTPFRSVPHYLALHRSLRPPLWRERRVHDERALAGAWTPPAPRPPDPGTPVVVVPGFGAPDAQVADLARWLAVGGWDVYPAGLVPRKRCGSVQVDELAARVATVAGTAGRRVVLVGHSRGGQLAKAVAVRRPDLVAGVVALGSPLTDPFGTHVVVRLLTLWLSWRTRRGAGDFVRECATGECCRGYHDAVVGRVPGDLPLWSVYSRSDGIVLPEAARDPQARLVEVDCSHAGLTVHPVVRTVLAAALADPRLAARCALIEC